MTLHRITNPKAPIGDVLDAAGRDGLLLETEGRPTYAMLPMDDDLLDYLLERNPALIDQCAQIRQRMREGQFHSHDQVRRMFRD